MKRKAKKQIVIWGEVWDDFDAWYQSFKHKECKSCGHTTRHEPDWEEQMCKIEDLVEKQLAK